MIKFPSGLGLPVPAAQEWKHQAKGMHVLLRVEQQIKLIPCLSHYMPVGYAHNLKGAHAERIHAIQELCVSRIKMAANPAVTSMISTESALATNYHRLLYMIMAMSVMIIGKASMPRAGIAETPMAAHAAMSPANNIRCACPPVTAASTN